MTTPTPARADVRRRQQYAAGNLAYLLTRDLPVMDWELSYHPAEEALRGLPDMSYTPEQEADAVRRWAAAAGLPAPVYTPCDDGIGGLYSSTGVYQGVSVRVHAFLETPPAQGGEGGG